MRFIWWKLRYAYYLSKMSCYGFWWCYKIAESAMEIDPDSIYEDGPKFYAEEEMSQWHE